MTDGDMKIHPTNRQILNSFRSGQVVNPVKRGYIDYRTDDIKAFMVQLSAITVPYSD